MNILLDTHILLWALVSPKKLPKAAVTAIHQAHEVFFSPVNLWEIGIKAAIYSPLRQNSCRLKFLKKIKFEIRDENLYKVF